MKTPEIRIANLNPQAARPDGDFVLYWMTANRRLHYNFSLQRAVELSHTYGKPLVILEALRCGYQWASDRLHTFVLQGMADTLADCPDHAVYYPYVEPDVGSGKGLLKALADRACHVVTDHYPAFMLPRMIQAAARQVDVKMEWVDSNGLLPMAAAAKASTRAFDFRRVVQKTLPNHFDEMPDLAPLEKLERYEAPDLTSIHKRWPPARAEHLADIEKLCSDLPIDHSVPPIDWRGGEKAARQRLETFLAERLKLYGTDRNHPDEDATSGLSGYLHFGHLSAHEVFIGVVATQQWTPSMIANHTKGSRSGWWNMSEEAEGFLDELITWREVGFNMCFHKPDEYTQFESLPGWAQQTLDLHADDPRPYVYSLAEFEQGATHDPIWNAAQNQLRQEGRIHNYMRMLWGKKILHWTASPRDALAIMVELNNKYAIDGRDPSSYSGIFWVLGRYDRAWGPERPIFGKIRYMTSKSAASKLRLKNYVKRYSGGQGELAI